jgi:hypothetical protein
MQDPLDVGNTGSPVVGKVAINPEVWQFVRTGRTVVNFSDTDLTDVSAVVLSMKDLENDEARDIAATGFGLPVFVVAEPGRVIDSDFHELVGVLSV